MFIIFTNNDFVAVVCIIISKISINLFVVVYKTCHNV